ncbi:MAG: transcriptional regulator [Rhizobiales bacterium 65-79]|jgi:transcriptional regulator with XRE-family HTH domain|nr:helix-turn-helix domain-containing protein [Hyphomicrobiales bacterium]OJU06867.1 MAG: transcriptional regulator [Rhizobiales bacterium 65-79]
MMTAEQAGQRHELGDFVRSMRERLTPRDVGLPTGLRRRTPGLRREEAAQLAGLSVTWYTWLEQGRDISLSPQALSRLAAALRLGRAERAYLFALAARRDPDEASPGNGTAQAAALSAVDFISAPAYILDRAWNALRWNAAARHLFAGWLDGSAERNLLRFIFLEPAARSFISDYRTRARRVVAEFRADVSSHLGDPEIRDLVAELERESGPFSRYWREHAVLGREGGERTFHHPTDGFLRYEQVTFALVGRPDLKLTILTQA